MAYNSRNKNRYACTYDEVLSFLKKQGHEVTNRKALDEAAVQTRYEARTQRHVKDALQPLQKAIRKKAQGLIDRIPDSTALPLLFWMSHLYSLESIKSHGRVEPEPGWLNFGYVYGDNNEITPKTHYGYDREAVKHLLTECFNKSPSLFISNVSVLSRAFKNAINNKSKNNDRSRLKNFISCNLPDAESHTETLTATKNLINIYKNHYSEKSVPSQKGPLIITLLSAAHSDPKWQPDSLLGKWPALLKYDADALGKIGDNKLLQAAEEAFGKPFSTRSDVVMEIDHLTEYEYTDLTIRDKYYRRITYHIKKHLPKNKAEAVNKSFTVSQNFSQLTKLDSELKSEKNVREAVAETLENIEEAKKVIADNNLFVANRTALPRISSRLDQETSNQLDALAKKLKGKNGLPARENRSVALELAILFKAHVDLTKRGKTYPSYSRVNDGYSRLIQLRNKAALEREAEQETITALEEKPAEDSETRETDTDHKIDQNLPESSLKELERKTQQTTHHQSQNSPGSSTEAPAVEAATGVHEGSDTQPNPAKEHQSLPTNQLAIQNLAAQAQVEPNLPQQQARATPLEGQQGELERIVEGAVEESRDAEERSEASDPPEKVSYTLLRTPEGKRIPVLARKRKR